MGALRWDCPMRGCFNKLKRPKLEVFDDYLPGKVSFGDVDAIVELGGHFLLQEWKDASTPDISGGQKYMYEAMTSDARFTVVIVYGDCDTMEVSGLQVFYGGKCQPRVKGTLDGLKLRVRHWAKRHKPNGKFVTLQASPIPADPPYPC